ncbi:MAG: guanylate kinase [Clostridia bacterium]|nr:guanylate kinase [Clostridia bacterium]
MMNKRRGLLVVFSGPSGSGKGTVLKEAMKKCENLQLSVSVTTRAPREGEVDGVDYIFYSQEQFKELVSQNGFLEWACFCENYYGTPRARIEALLSEGKDVVLEIEVQGAMKIREKCPDAVLIFNLPPSMEELKNRLEGRNTDAPEVIAKRLETAVWEISQAKKYDYVLVNDTVDNAANTLLAVIEGEKCNINRNEKLLAEYK